MGNLRGMAPGDTRPRRGHSGPLVIGLALVLHVVVCAQGADAQAGAAGGATSAGSLTASHSATDAGAPSSERDQALDALLLSVFPGGAGSAPADGRSLFQAVVHTPLFLSRAVGPFDLYVHQADGLAKGKDCQQVLESAAAGLAKVAPIVARHFGRSEGLISAHRFPIVLTSSDRGRGEHDFDRLVALVDRCEDGGLSGWKPANEVWTASNLRAEVMRTWEVQVFNLAHPAIAGQGKLWLQHGIGYYALAHVGNRLLRLGSWGLVPPWLGQGLIDELDIEAYGEAWVGDDAWTSQTPGWYRPGWSGFVPQGQQPPAPVTGPPADLGVVVQKTGNSWEQRAASGTRHWADLALDRKSAAPASFAFMARHESFLPRDRAYARCALHLLLDLDPGGPPGLMELLDHQGRTPASGMPDAEPLPVLFARALGGVPAVDALEQQTPEAMLPAIGRADLVERARAAGGAGLLGIPDHRAQAEWLLGQSMDMGRRTQLFQWILEAEYFQQLHEWALIGEHLDACASAALSASAKYPKTEKERAKVNGAFRAPRG